MANKNKKQNGQLNTLIETEDVKCKLLIFWIYNISVLDTHIMSVICWVDYMNINTIYVMSDGNEHNNNPCLTDQKLTK